MGWVAKIHAVADEYLEIAELLRPLGVDRTLTEIWHFRLVGAPEAIYRRSLWYYNLVSSRSTSPAATPADMCVTGACRASSWFSMKNFQLERWMTRL